MTLQLWRAASRATVVALVALSLSGCLSFAPAYDATLDAKSTAAFEGVTKIAASVELGEFAEKDSYASATDQYVQILADLQVASLRGETLKVTARGTSADARQRLVGFIRSCREKVTALADRHERSGLPPNAGLTDAMTTSCDIAARAARALQ